MIEHKVVVKEINPPFQQQQQFHQGNWHHGGGSWNNHRQFFPATQQEYDDFLKDKGIIEGGFYTACQGKCWMASQVYMCAAVNNKFSVVMRGHGGCPQPYVMAAIAGLEHNPTPLVRIDNHYGWRKITDEEFNTFIGENLAGIQSGCYERAFAWKQTNNFQE